MLDMDKEQATAQTLRQQLLDLDTAAVSDAMDSLGICRALHGIKQRVAGHKIAGPAFTVQYGPIATSGKGFRNAGNYIDDVPLGAVAVISNNGQTQCTNWGDILTTVAVKKGLAGTIIDGSARDISYVRDIGYPLYSRDIFMVSAKNRTEIKATQVPLTIEGTIVEPGDWIFGDENGVLVIAANHVKEVVSRAENVNKTEDRILNAITSGMPLVEARKTLGYATPWEAPEGNTDIPDDFDSYWRARVDFVDIHFHANPDTYTRRYSAIKAGQVYRDLKGAVLLKSHLGDTTSMAALCRDAGLPVFGSTGLNAIAGGVEIEGVARALAVHQGQNFSGRLVVDLPTVVETTHKSAVKRPYATQASELFSQNVAAIADTNGALTPQTLGLLDFCAEHDVVVTSGHATKAEIYALIEACADRKGLRLLLNQPANPISGMTASDLVALGHRDWLFVEQTALTYLLGYQDDADFYAVLTDVPNLIYSSDLGQTTQITPAEWHSKSTKWFDAAWLSEERVKDIRLNNPLKLLVP